MRVAVIGPAHPYKGGIAQHTTLLANHLSAVGVETLLVGWRNQYPRVLYPGEMFVPDGEHEVTPHPATRRVLAWNRPWTWARAAWRLRSFDAAVFVVVNPVQLLAYRMLLLLPPRVRRIALVHNVLPHESSSSDRALMRLFLSAVDDTFVHTEEQARLARGLGARRVVHTPLPGLLRPEPVGAPAPAGSALRVLSFGLVRPYKGIDLLIDAVAQVEGTTLTVAGESWLPEGQLEGQVRDLGIEDRVRLRLGYVPAAELSDLFAQHDLVALPYRSATGSGNLRLALDHQLPVLVTDVGDLGAVVGSAFGVVCAPDDVASLADGLHVASDPDRRAQWRRHLVDRPQSYAEDWGRYTSRVVEMLGAER